MKEVTEPVAVTFSPKDIMEIQRIVLDKSNEDALKYLKELLVKLSKKPSCGCGCNL